MDEVDLRPCACLISAGLVKVIYQLYSCSRNVAHRFAVCHSVSGRMQAKTCMLQAMSNVR